MCVCVCVCVCEFYNKICIYIYICVGVCVCVCVCEFYNKIYIYIYIYIYYVSNSGGEFLLENQNLAKYLSI